MIEAQDLSKNYNGTAALDGINFQVKEGEVFCLLGANGAGKTTTINLFLNFIMLAGLCLFPRSGLTQGLQDPWSWFEKVTFRNTFIKKLDGFYFVPQFDTAIKAHEGKRVRIQGYVIPMEDTWDQVILSRYPFSSCYFCGGAGPESIAEVTWKGKPPSIKLDQYVLIEGILRLNDKDYEHLNFIISEATLVPKAKR